MIHCESGELSLQSRRYLVNSSSSHHVVTLCLLSSDEK